MYVPFLPTGSETPHKLSINCTCFCYNWCETQRIMLAKQYILLPTCFFRLSLPWRRYFLYLRFCEMDSSFYYFGALEKMCHLQAPLSSQASVDIITCKRRTRHLQVTHNSKGDKNISRRYKKLFSHLRKIERLRVHGIHDEKQILGFATVSLFIDSFTDHVDIFHLCCNLLASRVV